MELHDAVASYLEVVRRVFHEIEQRAQPRSAVQLLWSPAQLQRQAVKIAEQSPQFSDLVEEVQETFAPKLTLLKEWDTDLLKSFFCRSRTYASLFSGKSINTSAITNALQEALSTPTHRVTYLALLDRVRFGADIIDCGSYRIKRFSTQELDALLENDVREVFYEECRIDTLKLEEYWFLVTEGAEPHPLCRDPMREEFNQVLEVSFSRYPRTLERALREFAIFRWDDYDPLSYALSPAIPFFIAVSDSLIIAPDSLWFPSSRPDLESMATFSFSGSREDRIPEVVGSLDESRTRDLEKRMQHIGRLAKIVRSHTKQWRFVDLAMGFLLKGYVTDGLESLLWNVVAMEALLGEKTNSHRRIGVRLAKALGKNKQEREEIRDLFARLYDIRSSLVHGDQRLFDEKFVKAHALRARDLACSLVLWMMGYVAEIADRWKKISGPLPSREQLLRVLDFAGEREQLAKLLGAVPGDFPCVSSWIDPGNLLERWRTRSQKPLTEEQKRIADELWE